ncbi:MAG: hypothetical protein ABIP75_01125, partial [Pyrinomonadaceae bacterium]
IRDTTDPDQPELVKARAFARGERLYILFYSGSGFGAAELEVADYFLSSFVITGTCAGDEAAGF